MADVSPPWVLFLDGGKPVSILPAGRPGEVADVRGWTPGVAEHLVKCANAFHDALLTAQMTKVAADINKLVDRLSTPPEGDPR